MAISLKAFLANLSQWTDKLSLSPRKDVKHTVMYGVNLNSELVPAQPHVVSRSNAVSNSNAGAGGGTSYTPPTGKYWILLFASATNNNRAATVKVVYLGATAKEGPAAAAAARYSTTDLHRMRITLQIDLTDGAFVPADVNDFVLTYEEYDL